MMTFSSGLFVVFVVWLVFAAPIGAEAWPINIAFVALPFESDLDVYAGLMAAQNEANSHIFGPNVELNITYIPGLSLTNSTAEFVGYFAKNVLYGRCNFLGFIAPSYTNSDALFQIMQKFNINKPIFGPDTITSYMASSQARNVINVKAPPTFESYQTLNFAMHSYMHCTYFMIFMLNFSVIIDLATSSANGMRNLGMRVSERILFQEGSDPFVDPLNRTAIREHFFDDPNDVPTCVVIIGTAPNVVEIIEALWEDDRFDGANTYFLGTSGALRRVFNSSKFGTKAFQNLYLTVGFASFLDTSIPSVAAHHEALRSYLATNPQPSPTLISSSDTTLQSMKPSYNTYQAYMTARLMIEVLRATISGSLSATAADVINTAYKTVFFQINETLLGPYSNGCRKDVVFPCFCNTGGRILYTVRINGSTGQLEHIPQSDPDVLVSFSTANLGICMLDLSHLDAPLNIVVTYNATMTQSEELFTVFRDTLTTSLNLANDNGQLAGVGKLRPIFVDSANASNLTAFFAKVKRRYLPLTLVGSDISTAASGLPSFLESYQKIQLTDPPLTSSDVFNAYSLQLLPVIADYIHLHAMFASERWATIPVTVVCETLAQQSLAVRSLNTFGLIPEGVGFSSWSQAEVDAIFVGKGRFVLLVVSQNETRLREVLISLVHAASVHLNRVVVLLACDEQFVYNLLMSQAIPLLGTQLEVYLASSLPNWWTGNTNNVSSPTALRVQLGSRALVTVTRTLQNGHTSDQLIQSIYASKTMLTGSDTLGPFYSTPCDEATIKGQVVARLCQCTKGPRLFAALPYSIGNTTNLTAETFTYTMKTCGVEYVPLPQPAAASFFTTGTIAGVASGSSFAFFTLCIIGVWFVVRLFFRDNRDAPKDGRSVTIVFTDIQSSTNLWARLPLVMAGCVVQHHAVIRRCLSEHRGYEVKTVGDSFMVAFVSPCDAVRFSMEVQEELLDTDWPSEVDVVYEEMQRDKELFAPASPTDALSPGASYVKCWHGLRVRIGLNSGPCDVVFDEVTKGFDYYGTTVNTAARVESVGHGGQVLISKSTYDELCGSHFDFSVCEVKECGSCPLRGLDHEIVLYQLLPKSLTSRRFGPLRLDVESMALAATEREGDEYTSVVDKVSSERSSLSDDRQIEIAAERYARRLGSASGSVTAQSILDQFQFFQIAFSTFPRQYRMDLVAKLRDKWNVNAHRRQPRETDDQVYAIELVSVLAKMCAIAATKMQLKLKMSSGEDFELGPGLRASF